MKKLASMLMAVLMVGAMAVTAFADDTPAPTYELSLKDYVADVQLQPAGEYSYEILLNGEALKAADLEGKKLTASVTKGGSAVETPKVEKSGDTYKLVIKTKDNYGTKDVDVSFRLRYSEGTKQLTSRDFTAVVGFTEMPDGDVYEELTVSNKAPILSKDVLEAFAKANNYRKGLMTAEGGEWSFEINTTGMKNAVNMSYNFKGIKEILSKYEDQEFLFVNFPGRPDFGIRGKMSIDVSNEYDSDDWGKDFYLYLYQDGKLYKLTSAFDADDMTVSFNASKLGSFVLTNKAIKDDGVISGGGSGNGNTQNPDTGANDVVGVAMALAVVSLISVAAVSMKKK